LKNYALTAATFQAEIASNIAPFGALHKVKARLKEAEKHHAEWSAKQEKADEGHR
jgi:hypothetical protein